MALPLCCPLPSFGFQAHWEVSARGILSLRQREGRGMLDQHLGHGGGYCLASRNSIVPWQQGLDNQTSWSTLFVSLWLGLHHIYYPGRDWEEVIIPIYFWKYKQMNKCCVRNMAWNKWLYGEKRSKASQETDSEL